MIDRNERARLRAQELHAEFANRREEQARSSQERQLARDMDKFIVDEARAKQEIEAELRIEHWGLDPERPLAWKDRADNASS